jgi:hypothetical protein
MAGNDRVRFCGECRLNVYNLSAMTRPEAEALLRAKEGRLCVRFYVRRDGTALTQDCPRGLAALRRGTVRLAARLAAAAVFLLSLVLILPARQRNRGTEPEWRDIEPVRTVLDWIDPRPAPPLMGAPPALPLVSIGEAVTVPVEDGGIELAGPDCPDLTPRRGGPASR